MNYEVKGFKNLINPETGEKYAVLINEIDKSENIEANNLFELNQIVLKQIINIWDFKYKRRDVVYWIIDNLDSNYCLFASQRYISEVVGCGPKTVYYTIKKLQELNFLQKTKEMKRGAYRINPLFLCYEDDVNSLGICYRVKE